MTAVETEVKIEVDEDLLRLTSELKDEQRVVTIHFTFHADGQEMLIRISPKTQLVSNQGGKVSSLIHAQNIVYYPYWQQVKQGKTLKFTLIFEALPNDCKTFDFIEFIPNEKGFEFYGLPRNESDIYGLTLM